jgi:mRNA interferase MazF
MKSGIMFEQGDILIVPFPFSDLSSIKQRPVLVISKTIHNKNTEDIITCGITSNLKDVKHSILINNNNLESGQIPTQSRIKVDKLFTLDRSIVKKRIAKLNNTTINKVKKEFLDLV